MFHRLCLCLLLATIGFATGAPAAILTGPDGQPVVGPDGNLVRQTPLESSCGASIARFCPELASTPGQTRNEVICLRPYRSSLPYFCRKAVNAAAK